MIEKKMSYITDKMIGEIGEEMLVIAMEELAELSQATSKLKRGKADLDNLAEEIADVIICTEAIKKIGGITETSIEKWIDFKLDRAMKRIREGNFK